MNRSIRDIFILLVILSNQKLCEANDSINISKSIRYDETLVSSGGSFELGFFTPGNSKNWYVGIWYKNIRVKTVVWVANRETPLKNSTSGVLKVIQPGILVLLNDTNNTIWSSNTSGVAQHPVAQLLDTGNLVLRDENDDQPENYLSSWKTNEDPAPGEFTVHVDPAGYPQIITKKNGTVTLCRIGPWNGLAFSGSPDVSNDPTFKFGLHMNKNGVYYRGMLLTG